MRNPIQDAFLIPHVFLNKSVRPNQTETALDGGPRTRRDFGCCGPSTRRDVLGPANQYIQVGCGPNARRDCGLANLVGPGSLSLQC